MAEWLGNGLQNHAQQFDSAWHLDLLVIDLLVISFSVINYVVSMSGPRVSGGDSFFYIRPSLKNISLYISAFLSSGRG